MCRGASCAAFTIDALGKDLRMLADVVGSPTEASTLVHRLTETGAVVPDDDIATLCTAQSSPTPTFADANLTVLPQASARPAVLAPLHAYARVVATLTITT